MVDGSIDKGAVQELAELARLVLSPAQQAAATERLGRVLAAFEALRRVDTSHVDPSPYPLPLQLHLRPDIAEPAMPPDQVLANAPEQAAGAFLVPRVVEG